MTSVSNPKLRHPQKRNTRSRGAMMSALVSLLESRPSEQITVREITDEAGVGYATFFRHFSDKGALMQAIATDEISRLLAVTLPLVFTDETRPSTEALCDYVWERRAVWSNLLTGGAASFFKDEFSRQAQEVALQHPKLGDSLLPGDLPVVFSVGAAIEIIAWWLKQTDPCSVDQMAQLLDRLVVKPIID